MEIKSVIFYLIVFCSASILGLAYQILKKRGFKIFAYICYIISFIEVLIVSALRYGIGTDFFMYEDIQIYSQSATSINQIIERYDVELGWAILNYFLGRIFNQPQCIFWISAFIFIFCMYKTILYYEDRINIGMAIFIGLVICYLPSFNYVRQYVSIGILMISIKYIEKKKMNIFLVLVIIASMFHYTSILFIFVYYLINNNINLVKAFILLSGAMGVYIFYNEIISMIVSISPAFSKYARYSDNGIFDFNKTLLIFQLFFVGIILFSKSKLKRSSEFMHNLTYLYYITIFLSILGNRALFVGRVANYFEIVQIIFISYICKNSVRVKDKPIFYIAIIGVYLTYWYISFVYSGNNQCLPYISV